MDLPSLCLIQRRPTAQATPASRLLQDFWLDLGLPVWRYSVAGVEFEKRVLMPHRQNTVLVTYRHALRPGTHGSS